MNAAAPERTPTLPIDGLSHVAGWTDIPLSDATIYGLLADTAKCYPDRPAVVFREQGVRWTWLEFLAEVDAFGAGLAGLGLVKGDRVGIWSPNRVEWLVTQFATARQGLVLVNVNPAYRLSELAYALQVSGCRAIVSAERLRTSMYLEMLDKVRPELPAMQFVIRMGDDKTAGMLNYADVLERGRGEPVPFADCMVHDAINIQFTSGTTGNPKGATLTHHNVVNNGRFIAMAMDLSEDDSLCIPVPLYHRFGMVLGVLASVSTGAAMVFPGEAFDPVATLSAVEEERCTALHGVPTMFIAELGHPRFDEFDLSSLRTGIMAGSPCPIETMKQVVSRMHMREVTIAYGMTETSPVSFQSSTSDPLDRRTTTVGRVQPHLECKVIDVDGNVVPVDEKGELCTRGYSVMTGYWGDEARTRQAVVDGWMHTGDLATIDEQGFCNIVGRVKDMLIRGGENVYPREIEEFLFRHPKVQSVQVFGVPDLKYGEEVCAWIVLKPGEAATEDEVKDFCRDQIAHYKVPCYVRFVPELPMTVTGKAQKFVMRDQMIAELNLQRAATA
ncbi:MAG: AMP-binding protein [Burkholderiaceae bacterium]